MDKVTIKLSIPHASLSPNARVHWGAKVAKAKQQRETAAYLALAETHCARPKWARATLEIRAYCRKGKIWDQDNLISALKSAIDGVCRDAGLMVDDRTLIIGRVHIEEATETNPHVELEFAKF